MTGYGRSVTDTPVPEADEADVLEQAAPLEERPALEEEKLQDPLVEADPADVYEQSQSVPADPDDRR